MRASLPRPSTSWRGTMAASATEARAARTKARALRRALEGAGAGPLPPSALDRRLLSRRDLPVGLEPAEVVEADEVHEPERGAEALDPPRVAGPVHLLPAVERVAPELAGGAEVIGRHAGHERRRPVGLELEQLGVRPHVRAVAGHEDRDVAHDRHLPLAAVVLQPLPLGEEDVLAERAG